MSGYLTYLLVAQQEAALAERARRPPPPSVRPGRRRPGPLRTRTARLLVHLALRLDGQLQPAAARVVPSGAHT